MSDISLVMDCGGYRCRIGRSGNDAPESQFRSLISLDNDSQFIHNNAMMTIENYKCPIERGVVVDWDGLEKLWSHAFSSMQCDSRDFSVLLTESILNPKSNREKMMQILFELFGVPFGYIALEPILNIYSSGRGTALSVMTGDGNSQVLPICEGYLISKGMFKSDFGGSDITLYLTKLLEENGKLNFSRNIVDDIKKKLCDCTGDGSEKPYKLPDGGTVLIGDEAKRAADLMFDPSPICNDELSIPDLVLKSMQNTEIDQMSLFYNNIVVGGGNSMVKNFSGQLQAILVGRQSNTIRAKVVAPDDRLYSTWLGGSILSSLSSFQSIWISHRDYEDFGPSIIHRKCVN